MILKHNSVFKIGANLALLMLLCLQCDFKSNDQKGYDCKVSWSMMQVFLNDTGNKKLLGELDSQLTLCYLQDSNNHLDNVLANILDRKTANTNSGALS